jgi:hypothetical protein
MSWTCCIVKFTPLRLLQLHCTFLENLREQPKNSVTRPGTAAGMRTQHLPNATPTGYWYPPGAVSTDAKLQGISSWPPIALSPYVPVAWCCVNCGRNFTVLMTHGSDSTCLQWRASPREGARAGLNQQRAVALGFLRPITLQVPRTIRADFLSQRRPDRSAVSSFTQMCTRERNKKIFLRSRAPTVREADIVTGIWKLTVKTMCDPQHLTTL